MVPFVLMVKIALLKGRQKKYLQCFIEVFSFGMSCLGVLMSILSMFEHVGE
jgi:hypothetical protein